MSTTVIHINQLREALESERAAHEETKARASKAERAFQWLESHQQGYKIQNCFLQRIDQERNTHDAKSLLAAMLDQQGCVGGRVIRANQVQTFWEVEQPPSLWALLEFDQQMLPEEMRLVHIPSVNMALQLGVDVSRIESL